jgi:hypothetical protein
VTRATAPGPARPPVPDVVRWGLGGVLWLALLAACTTGPGAGDRQLASSTASAPASHSTAPAPPSSRPAPAGVPASAVPPVQAAAAPAGAAGRLATWAPPAAPPAGETGAWLQVWFSGVPIGRDGPALVVAYPSVVVASNARQVAAHAKVAVFRCTRRFADGTPNYAGCRRRAVEYADLVLPAAQLSRGPDGVLTLTGRFPTYTYPAAVDRGARLRPRWTGRTYLVRIDVWPVTGGTGTVVATGMVTLGAGSAAVSTPADAGYPNRILVRLGPSSLRHPALPPATGPRSVPS